MSEYPPSDVDKAVVLHRDHAFTSTAQTAAFIVLVTFAQLFTQLNNALVIWIFPPLSARLGFTAAEEVWPVAAYSLIVGAFVLITGRLGVRRSRLRHAKALPKATHRTSTAKRPSSPLGTPG
jgi:MFS family permease